MVNDIAPGLLVSFSHTGRCRNEAAFEADLEPIDPGGVTLPTMQMAVPGLPGRPTIRQTGRWLGSGPGDEHGSAMPPEEANAKTDVGVALGRGLRTSHAELGLVHRRPTAEKC